MPVLDPGGDHNDIAGRKTARILSPFLIPTRSRSTEQDLPASFVGVMDMPIVAAPGFTSHSQKAIRIPQATSEG